MSRRNRKARAVASCGSSHTATAQVSEALPVSNGVRIPPSVDTGYAYDANGMLRQGMAIDAGMAQKLYGPAKTLGAPQDVQMACDNALEESGVYSLLAHTINMGSAPLTQFMGYGALQGLAQNGLIRACVETVADDMTRNWIELKREGEVGAEKKTTGDIFMESLGLAPKSDEEEIVENTLIADLNAAMEKYNLQKVFHEAATLVGYEGGALVFIDTGAQGDELKLPLNMTEYSQELRGNTLRFICIDPVNVFPGPYNATSPLREDYFKPSSWWVLGQEVHASRLLRLTANECPVLLKPAYNFFGIPQAQILWDYVLHFQECRVASQRLLSKFSLTVFKTPMAEVLTEAEGTALLDRRMAYMVKNRSNDGILCIDKETEDVVKLETPISGVTDVVRQSLEILAALNRTPAVKLLGISPSGFNATGESDIRNYYDHIRSQQEKVFREALTTCLNVIQVHDKGEIDKSVSFEFAALGEADNAAIATTQKTKTDTMVALLQNNVISPEEARRALADDPDSGFNNIDVDELPEPQGGMEGMGEGFMPEGGEAGAEQQDIPDNVQAQAQDAKIWRKNKQNKNIEIDTETGKVTKGNVGQKGYEPQYEALSSPVADMKKYNSMLAKHGNDHVAAAHEYFKDVLQGRYVECPINNAKGKEYQTQAIFNADTWEEVKKWLRDDPIKAALIPYMPDILTTGSRSDGPAHHAKPGVKRVFTFSKIIQTQEGPKEVLLDANLMKKDKKLHVHNLTREGTWNYEERKKLATSAGSNPAYGASVTGDSLTATTNSGLDDDFLEGTLEIVNIRFAGEPHA